MLVLSRRQHERILFPTLDITVEVVRIAGQVVRIGVHAPPDVPIARAELTGHDTIASSHFAKSRQLRHELRNRLNAIALGLHVLQRRLQVESTLDLDVEALFGKLIDQLQELDDLGSEKSTQARSFNSIKKPRVLIVEDNPNERELLTEYLRTSGYVVDSVADGAEAISYLQRQSPLPEAVLLDMYMPKLDGPRTIQSIRCEPSWHGLKLFAVSGADQRELGVQSGDKGVDHWFSKPVNAPALVAALNKSLEN